MAGGETGEKIDCRFHQIIMKLGLGPHIIIDLFILLLAISSSEQNVEKGLSSPIATNSLATNRSACSKWCRSPCDETTGQCASCVPGYQPPYCKRPCPSGYYGLDCQLECSRFCSNGKCNQINGRCYGCKMGYRGLFCRQQCAKGTFGESCSSSCPETCRDGLCQHKSGECFACVDGYMGNMCEQFCAEGSFGLDCAFKCSPHCRNSHCDPVIGECMFCFTGFVGIFCNESCPDKSFGVHCSQPCPPSCLDMKCKNIDGSCLDCPDGYDGKYCTQNATARMLYEDSSRQKSPYGMFILMVFGIVTAIVVGGLNVYGYRKLKKEFENVESVHDYTQSQMSSSIFSDDDNDILYNHMTRYESQDVEAASMAYVKGDYCDTDLPAMPLPTASFLHSGPVSPIILKKPQNVTLCLDLHLLPRHFMRFNHESDAHTPLANVISQCTPMSSSSGGIRSDASFSSIISNPNPESFVTNTDSDESSSESTHTPTLAHREINMRGIEGIRGRINMFYAEETWAANKLDANLYHNLCYLGPSKTDQVNAPVVLPTITSNDITAAAIGTYEGAYVTTPTSNHIGTLKTDSDEISQKSEEFSLTSFGTMLAMKNTVPTSAGSLKTTTDYSNTVMRKGTPINRPQNISDYFRNVGTEREMTPVPIETTTSISNSEPSIAGQTRMAMEIYSEIFEKAISSKSPGKLHGYHLMHEENIETAKETSPPSYKHSLNKREFTGMAVEESQSPQFPNVIGKFESLRNEHEDSVAFLKDAKTEADNGMFTPSSRTSITEKIVKSGKETLSNVPSLEILNTTERIAKHPGRFGESTSIPPDASVLAENIIQSPARAIETNGELKSTSMTSKTNNGTVSIFKDQTRHITSSSSTDRVDVLNSIVKGSSLWQNKPDDYAAKITRSNGSFETMKNGNEPCDLKSNQGCSILCDVSCPDLISFASADIENECLNPESLQARGSHLLANSNSDETDEVGGETSDLSVSSSVLGYDSKVENQDFLKQCIDLPPAQSKDDVSLNMPTSKLEQETKKISKAIICVPHSDDRKVKKKLHKTKTVFPKNVVSKMLSKPIEKPYPKKSKLEGVSQPSEHLPDFLVIDGENSLKENSSSCQSSQRNRNTASYSEYLTSTENEKVSPGSESKDHVPPSIFSMTNLSASQHFLSETRAPSDLVDLSPVLPPPSPPKARCSSTSPRVVRSMNSNFEPTARHVVSVDKDPGEDATHINPKELTTKPSEGDRTPKRSFKPTVSTSMIQPTSNATAENSSPEKATYKPIFSASATHPSPGYQRRHRSPSPSNGNGNPHLLRCQTTRQISPCRKLSTTSNKANENQ